MRVRLKTQPPLPPLKAWYLLPPLPSADPYTAPCIAQLKAELLHLQGLRNTPLSPDLLLLSIDGFDLLDETPWEVIKENDLIVIQLFPNTVPSTDRQFQKAEFANEGVNLPHTPHPRKNPPGRSDRYTLIAPPPPPSGSSALALGKRKRRLSSLSSSDSGVSSTSSSSSSSSASSSSSSSSSSAPSVHVSRPKDFAAKKKVVPPAISFTKIVPSNDQAQEKNGGAGRTVPPGQGMNKTHERNRRRRELRRARRSQSEGHAANILPSGRGANTNNSLGQPSPGPPDDESLGPAAQPLSATATPLHPSAITPSYSLKNKNKKKGFRQAMEKTQPMRIVFGDKNGDVANEAASVVMGDTSTAIDEPRPLPTLIPPSQRNDLPPNLFVTSVNVEADLWGPKNEHASHPQGESHAIGSENVEIYGDTNGEMAVFSPSSVDWDALDSSWPGLPVVSRFLNGTIVAWQELGIDPATLSPKMMMSLGRVISHDDTSQTVRIVDIVRPEAEMIGFGYGAGLPSDDSVLGPDGVEDTVRELALNETKGWRVFWTPA